MKKEFLISVIIIVAIIVVFVFIYCNFIGVEEIERHDFDTILGHNVSIDVNDLIYEVQQAFPEKRLLIHPYALAEEESGKSVRSDALAVSMTEINDYIAIWIKKRFGNR